MGSDAASFSRLRMIWMFQFTLPHGERPAPTARRCRWSAFQFTLPHGERRATWPSSPSSTPFQFTLPHGERPPGWSTRAGGWLFQFTLPHGERRVRVGPGNRHPEFQFTLPHGERLAVRVHHAHHRQVSIHAPAWGATHHLTTPPSRTTFQFTLPHGERPGASRRTAADAAFQFTLPHGERHLDLGCDLPGILVSIHAPAWGATWRFCRVSRGSSCFNSRSRMGSDRRTPAQSAGQGSFNSRSRMGSDA